jgi:hypothetical protein
MCEEFWRKRGCLGKVVSPVGGTLDSAERASQIDNGSIAFSEADVDRFSHSAREGRVCRRAIETADLIHARPHSGQVLLEIVRRRRG